MTFKYLYLLSYILLTKTAFRGIIYIMTHLFLKISLALQNLLYPPSSFWTPSNWRTTDNDTHPFINKLLGNSWDQESIVSIAKRHAEPMPRAVEFPSTFSLALSPLIFVYPFLSLLFSVTSISVFHSDSLFAPSPFHDSYALSLFLFRSSRVTTLLARTQCRNRECTLNFGGPGTYTAVFFVGVIPGRGTHRSYKVVIRRIASDLSCLIVDSNFCNIAVNHYVLWVVTFYDSFVFVDWR